MSRRRVSLTDVARAAGVGLATASRALTGSAEVGAATRARILETASELGYRPSAAAQALRTGRSRTIEVVLHDGGFPAAVVQAAFECCTANGYHLLLSRSAPGQETPSPAVDGRLHLLAGGLTPPPDDVPSEHLDLSGRPAEGLDRLVTTLLLRIISQL